MDKFSPNFILLFILTRSKFGLLAVIFRKFVRVFWPLIDVRIMLPLNILRHSGLLLHARHCSRAIVRFSDNSSFYQNDFLSTREYQKHCTPSVKFL